MTLLVPGRRAEEPAGRDEVDGRRSSKRPDASKSAPTTWRPAATTHRIIVVVGAIGLFGPALIAWTTIIQLPLVGVVATVGCAAALAIAVLAATAPSERRLDRLDRALLCLGVAIMGAWAATELYFQPAYGTDEAAFVQYAAQLLLHGHDPYRANLLPALTQFRVPIQFATYKLNGTISSSLAYPSLSFLLAVPASILTNGVQSIILENVVALAVEMVLVFVFLPRPYRALSVVLVLGLPFLFDYTIGGDIITMALPLLVYVAHRWWTIGEGGRLGKGGAGRAVCMGLAGSICQFPWFVVPFLVVGLWKLRSSELGRRRALAVVTRFAGVTAAVAFTVNAPFLMWDPRAWLSGVLTPLFQKAIPFGQGLIDATAFLHVGGGDLEWFTAAAICIAVLLLVAYALYFPLLRGATFILPSIIFLFSTRSLSEYFIMMVAMWAVSVVPHAAHRQGDVVASRKATGGSRLLGRRAVRWAFLGGPLAAAIACIGLALGASAPLAIHVLTMRTNGQLRSIWRIKAQVANRSDKALAPHFATDASGYMTTFWNVLVGPSVLRPGQRATYVLVAPNVGSMPGVTQPFVLQAVTASPDTMSSSSLVTPEHFSATITPSYVDRLVPLGQEVSLTVQLRSPYGAMVHRAGVRVALGQVIYGQNALIPGEAIINHAPEGRSPVDVRTDATGVAHFVIVDRVLQQGNPLYFQAYVDPPHSFPYGYSEVVSVEWVPERGNPPSGGPAPVPAGGGGP